jgi:Putative adhesin
MNRFCIFLTATFLAAGANAEEVQRTIDAAANGSVDVSNISGMVEIMGWSRNEVSVDADLGSDVDELVVKRDRDQIIIEVQVPRRNSRNIESDLVIRVPERSAVSVGTISADILVQDVLGSQTLHTVSGGIESEAYAADIEIETVSGDVSVQGDGKQSNARINTVSGDIDAEQLGGDVMAGTVSGDINVLNGTFKRARLNTTNGDMVFHAALGEDGRFDAETINGEVDIHFQRKISARFEIETFNGDIRNCFGPEPVRTSEYTPGLELYFSEGDGDGWVTIITLNGDIELCND